MTSRESQDTTPNRSEIYSYGSRHYTNRSAATHAAFFLHHIGPNMALVDCGCSSGSITVDLAGVVAPGPVHSSLEIGARRWAGRHRGGNLLV